MGYYLRLHKPFSFLFLTFFIVTTVSSGLTAQNRKLPTATIKEAQDLIREGDYERGLDDLVILISQKDQSAQERTIIFKLIVTFCLLSNQYDKAEYYAELAVAEATSNNLKDDISDFEIQQELIKKISQALNYRKNGDILKSNVCFENAYRLTEAGDNEVFRLKIAAIWSINYTLSSRLPIKYLDLNIEALRIARSLGYKLEACRAASRLGAYYATTNRYSFALSYFLEALQYKDKSPDSIDRARVLNNISYIYLSLGDYEKALDYLSIAHESVLNLNLDPLQALALINLGNLYLSQARSSGVAEYYEAAKKCFLAFLDIYPTDLLDVRAIEAKGGVVSVLIDQGKITEAEEYLAPLLVFLDRPDTSNPIKGTIKLLKAELELESNLIQESTRSYQEALRIAMRGDIPLLLMNAYCGLGKCAIAEHDNMKAIELFNLSIGVLNELYSRITNDFNRASFFSRCLEPFDALISLYANLPSEGDTDLLKHEAFRLVEFFRARSILEFQKGFFPDEGEAQAPASNSLKSLNKQRIDLIKSLAQPTSSDIQAADIKKEIVRIDDSLDEFFFRSFSQDRRETFIQPTTVEILQNTLLSPKRALIEYYLGYQESIIFFITDKSYKIIKLPSSSSIYDAVAGYLTFLSNPSIRLEKGFPAAARLYKLLLAPALEYSPPTVEQIIIIPDGILFKLPFESLVIKGSSRSDVSYVNDRFTVSYAPSASSLLWLRGKPKSTYKKELLAIGISSYPDNNSLESFSLRSAGSILSDIYKRKGFSLGPIPYVKDELSDLKKRFPRDKADYFCDSQATESAFKKAALTDYRIIHLACHALSNDIHPLRSALVLLPNIEAEEDGFLQLSELFDLSINSDLVVLAACATSSGKITPNEGILGMPRIFLYTGAQATISTLWPVDDKLFSKLMSLFYDEYLKGTAKAKALQVAKQRMSRDSSIHPYFWASCILTGDY